MTGAGTAVAVLDDARRHPVAAIVHSFPLTAAVAAAVVASALGLGVMRAARHPAQGLLPDVVVVSRTAASSSGVQAGLPSSSLTNDDVQALSKRGFVPDATAAAVPTAGLHAAVVSVARSWKTDIIGTTPSFTLARGYTTARGRFLTALDVQAAAPVVVVGQTVVNGLFAGDDPIGQAVQIENHAFQVVGVLSARGVSGGFDQDNLVVMPITSAWAGLVPNNEIDQVLIKAVSAARTDAVKAEATATLRQRHQIINPAAADFQVHTAADLRATEQQTAQAVRRTLVLAAVLLVIGAVVHLNTLLTSRPGRWSAAPGVIEPPEGRRDPLAEALTRAGMATVLGLALAAVSARAVGGLVGDLPPPVIAASGLLWGVATGVLTGGLAWIACAFRPGTPPTSHSL